MSPPSLLGGAIHQCQTSFLVDALLPFLPMQHGFVQVAVSSVIVQAYRLHLRSTVVAIEHRKSFFFVLCWCMSLPRFMSASPHNHILPQQHCTSHGSSSLRSTYFFATSLSNHQALNALPLACFQVSLAHCLQIEIIVIVFLGEPFLCKSQTVTFLQMP